MRYLYNLRAQLQERRNRLYKIRFEEFENELGQLLEFVDGNQFLRTLVARLEASDAIGFDQWLAAMEGERFIRLPKSEAGRAKVCHGLLQRCAHDPEEREALNWAHNISHETNHDNALRELIEAVVDPFVNYLHDRVDEASNILYLIQRFKVRAEWFQQRELHEGYVMDTRRGEALLDKALRQSLLDGGIDYPFSQPASPSGRADIVAALGSGDPLVMEVKVFDPDRGRGVARIRQGLHQILRYADDYNESVGYLVVFNCSDGQLLFRANTSEELELPPRLIEGGKSFYLIAIDIGVDRLAASKEHPSTRTVIGHEELLGADPADTPG